MWCVVRSENNHHKLNVLNIDYFFELDKHGVKMDTKGVEQVIEERLFHIDSKGNLKPYETVVLRNPFKSMLDMVTCYHNIYQTGDLNRLKAFLGPSSDNEFNISHIDMFKFVCQMFLDSNNPKQDYEWMNFDGKQIDSILDNEFFSEYNRVIGPASKYYKRAYPYLDVYSFIRLQSYATTVLPQSLLWDINYIWTFEDFIEQIMHLGFFESISLAYKSLGIHWFANNAENDPVKYKWACLAVSACKKTGLIDDDILKNDLLTINKDLVLAFSARGSLEKNKEIFDFVQDCIINFNVEKIQQLSKSVEMLQSEKEKLVNDQQKQDECVLILRNQIQELQRKSDSLEFDKIEEIAQKINFLSPQNDDFDDRLKLFECVWNKLDKTSKKDIKLSLSMFELFDSFDLAMFPMIRSLEHEMNENFFIPFHNSKYYRDAGTPKCSNNAYLKTHEALIKKLKVHPTMGNISYIGRSVNDKRATQASNIINAFRLFLGQRKNVFIDICNALENYRIGAQRFRLVDLRNGIAHGDDKITNGIDKNCYDDVRKILYEPPIEILIKVINNSFK